MIMFATLLLTVVMERLSDCLTLVPEPSGVSDLAPEHAITGGSITYFEADPNRWCPGMYCDKKEIAVRRRSE